MKYGYARVSTNRQDLKTQIEKLKHAGAQKIFTEKYTGTKISGRKELNELISTIKIGDEIIVTKIDRLARSITDLKVIIEEVTGQGAAIKFIDNHLYFESGKSDAMNTLMLNMLGSFAEFERDLIVSRTQEGKAFAKKNKKDYKEGRPKRNLNEKKYQNILKLLDIHTYKEVAEITGLNKSTLVRIKQQSRELEILEK